PHHIPTLHVVPYTTLFRSTRRRPFRCSGYDPVVRIHSCGDSSGFSPDSLLSLYQAPSRRNSICCCMFVVTKQNIVFVLRYHGGMQVVNFCKTIEESVETALANVYDE